MRCLPLLGTGALAALLLPGAPARASLPDIAGLGARAPALGGTGAASGPGYEAVYQNPAGLLGARRRLTVGTALGAYQTQLDAGGHPIDGTAGLLIGATLPLPLGGFLRDRLTLGFGFFLPLGVINRARIPFPEVPRAALLDARTQVVSVLLGAGARLGRGLRLGLSVLALAALVGETRIAPDGGGNITAASQSQLTVDYAPIAGIGWDQGPLSLGLVYRAASRSTFENKVTSQLGDTVPVDLPTIVIAGVSQYDPHQIGAEAAFRLGGLLLGAQLTWKHWSAFPQPLVPATAGAQDLPPPGYHDTLVPRLGLEWQPPGTERTPTFLRLGYFFEWSPAPLGDREDGRALLDADRHVICAGLGHKLPRVPLTLDAFLQWHQLAGSARLTGHFLLGGVTLGVDL